MAIKKNNSVAPNAYNALEAFKFSARDDTQCSVGGKEKIESMFVKIRKAKKYIPGVGHYDTDI